MPLSKLRLSDYYRIIKEIKLYNPRIVHIHGLQGEGFVGLITSKIARVPYILTTVHGMQQDSITISRFKRYVFRLIIEPIILKYSNAVYCVSEEMEKREYIIKHTKNLLPYIHNFMPIKDTIVMDKEEKRKELDLLPQDLIVIVVGRISIDKGMKIIEKCVIENTNPNIKFILVGDGEYRDQMENNLSKYIKKNVVFIGQVPDVREYLLISDVYLSASLHENLSIALLEACSNSLAAIVTDVGDNKKVVLNNVSGFLLENNNHVEILDHLYELFRNRIKLRNMGDLARMHVFENFSENKFINCLDKVYTIGTN